MTGVVVKRTRHLVGLPDGGDPKQALVKKSSTDYDVEWANTNEAAYFDFYSDLPAPAYKEGRVYYDSEDKALSVYSDIANTSLQIGQEQFVRVVNKTGVVLADGSVVYINGAQGNRPTAALADADLDTAKYTIGVVTADIANHAEGYITVHGVVRGLDTRAYTTGDILYLSQTPGQLTKTPPTLPANTVRVGYALNSTVSGSILVAIECSTAQPFLSLNTRTVVSTPVVTNSDYTLRCDATAGAFAASLPAATAANRGRVLVYKKVDSTANPVVVGTADNAEVVLITPYQAVRLQSNGTTWDII